MHIRWIIDQLWFVTVNHKYLPLSSKYSGFLSLCSKIVPMKISSWVHCVQPAAQMKPRKMSTPRHKARRSGQRNRLNWIMNQSISSIWSKLGVRRLCPIRYGRYAEKLTQRSSHSQCRGECIWRPFTIHHGCEARPIRLLAALSQARPVQTDVCRSIKYTRWRPR